MDKKIISVKEKASDRDIRFPERYIRNLGTITAEEQAVLKNKSVCVIGCGGLGGGIIEGLCRMGVGRLTVVDGDVFDETNLNRQIVCHERNIGCSKAEEAAHHVRQINSEVQVIPLQEMLDEGNALRIITGHDAVVDALDSAKARLVLEKACEGAGLQLIHGAINGWNGQVAVVSPGNRILQEIYESEMQEAIENEPSNMVWGSNPSFTPAVVGGIQVAETIKVLLGRKEVLANKLLMIDLFNQEYEIIDFVCAK